MEKEVKKEDVSLINAYANNAVAYTPPPVIWFSEQELDDEFAYQIDQLEKSEKSGMNLSVRYFKFKKNVPVKCVFGGFQKIAVPDRKNEYQSKILETVVFATDRKSVYRNGSSILVSDIKHMGFKFGDKISIEWTDDKEVKLGMAKIFDVYRLVAK
jgi:hypothetical protein